jgi:hypothetical protein
VHNKSAQEIADELAKVDPESGLPGGQLEGLPPTGEGVVENAEAYSAEGRDPGEPSGEQLEASRQASSRSEVSTYQPLPEGWDKSNKTGLLSFCEERQIDVSDAPSNRDLRKRLEDYEGRHG